MGQERIRKGFRALAAVVAVLLLVGFFPGISQFRVAAEEGAAGATINALEVPVDPELLDQVEAAAVTTAKERKDNFIVTYMQIKTSTYTEGASEPKEDVLYEYKEGKQPTVSNASLLPNTSVTCYLEWEATDEETKSNFKPGDYFDIPIMKVNDGKWSVTSQDLPLYIDKNDKATRVGEGEFWFDSDNQLLYRVLIDDELALSKMLLGGDAYGYAGLSMAENIEKVPVTYYTDKTTYQYKIVDYYGNSINSRSVDSPTVAILKSDEQAGIANGEIQETVFTAATGIPDVEFEVYRAGSPGTPLKFRKKSDGTYRQQDTGSNLVTAVKTDAKGKIQIAFDDSDRGAKMTLKEVSTPKGYTPVGPLEFVVPNSVDGKDVLVYYNINNSSNSVTINKRENTAGGSLITSGKALFQLEHSADNGATWAKLEKFDLVDGKYYRYNANGSVTELWTIDGVVKISMLPAGQYRLTEQQAPDGYTKSGTPETFTLKDGDKTITLDFVNKKKTTGGGGGGGGGSTGGGGGSGGGSNQRDKDPSRSSSSTKEEKSSSSTPWEEDVPLTDIPDNPEDSGMSIGLIKDVPDTGGNAILPMLAMLMVLSGAVVAAHLFSNRR